MPAKLRFPELPQAIKPRVRELYELVNFRRYYEAIPGLAELFHEYPAFVTGAALLGKALRETGELERAREVYAAAAAIAPEDPDVQIGLAWAELETGDLEAAERHAVATLVDPHRGDALAILAQILEARGDRFGAAAKFLEAYEVRPQRKWLEAHARLLGKPFDESWPLSPAERLWLYASIDHALSAIATDRGLPADDIANGCNGSTRSIGAWADKRGIDRARLYQALSARGANCDCEVLLNASSDDERFDVVLFAGRLDISAVHFEEAMESYEFHDSAPLIELADFDVAPLAVGLTNGGIELYPQAFRADLVGEIMRRLFDDAIGHSCAGSLLLAYPDAPEPPELVLASPGQLVATPLGALPPSHAWLEGSLAKVRRRRN